MPMQAMSPNPMALQGADPMSPLGPPPAEEQPDPMVDLLNEILNKVNAIESRLMQKDSEEDPYAEEDPDMRYSA